jgi:hypothetical protein
MQKAHFIRAKAEKLLWVLRMRNDTHDNKNVFVQ